MLEWLRVSMASIDCSVDASHAAMALGPISPDRDALIVAAQANRDRRRLAVAAGQAAVLRRRIQRLEDGSLYEALASLSRVPVFAPLRKITAGKFLRHTEPTVPEPVQTPGRGTALIIDHAWPQPDRDSGSVDIVVMAESLGRLGFYTILAAARQHDGHQPARDALETRGLRCLGSTDAPSVEEFIAAQGSSVDLCVLCRAFCGGEFLEQVEKHCWKARIVFQSIDLNYVREERRAELLNDDSLRVAVVQSRLWEERLIRRCDATIVVSELEQALLAETQPECLVVQMPLVRAFTPPTSAFERRSGIGFIGGFAHAPNVDGIRFFLGEIWPLIHRALPDCELTIVGADAPAGLLDGVEGPVRVLGHVRDIGPWFESLRLTVAPLRFGAGAKGKVASSLAVGVPCVVTPIAAEGMALEGAGVLVAETPVAFADAVRDIYTRPELWQELSRAAQEFAKRTLSQDQWQARLDMVLRRIGL